MKQARTFHDILQLCGLRLKSIALPLLLAQQGVWLTLLRSSARVRKEPITINHHQGQQSEAWRYSRSPLKKRPAFILLIKTYQAHADNFILQIAKTLAWLGYHVIIPDIQQDDYLKNSSVVARKISNFISGVVELPYIQLPKVGIISAYFASLPLLLALKKYSLADKIGTFLLLAPAANLRRLAHFAFQGKFSGETQWHYRRPDSGLRIALVKNFTDPPSKIKRLLSELLIYPRSWGLKKTRDLPADDQTAIVALLQNSWAARQYEVALKKILSQLDLFTGPLPTERPVFLLHGIADTWIPFGETLHLSRRLRSLGGVHYTLSAILYADHIMPLVRNPARWFKGIVGLSALFYRWLACLHSTKNLPCNRAQKPLRFKL